MSENNSELKPFNGKLLFDVPEHSTLYTVFSFDSDALTSVAVLLCTGGKTNMYVTVIETDRGWLINPWVSPTVLELLRALPNPNSFSI